MVTKLSRRDLLTASAIVGSTLAFGDGTGNAATISEGMPWAPGAADKPTSIASGPYQFFDAHEASWIDAAVSRLIPHDDVGPGARELGVTVFLDRQLAGSYGRAERWYMAGPWRKGTQTQGYQSRMTPAQLYRAAIKAIDAYCSSTFGNKRFPQLTGDEQDKVLGDLEEGSIKLDDVDAKAFFKQLLLNTQEGYFADPLYGGNRDMGAWKMIGFPGARYDYRDYVKRHGERLDLPPVSLYGRPAWTSNG